MVFEKKEGVRRTEGQKWQKLGSWGKEGVRRAEVAGRRPLICCSSSELTDFLRQSFLY